MGTRLERMKTRTRRRGEDAPFRIFVILISLHASYATDSSLPEINQTRKGLALLCEYEMRNDEK